MFRQETVWKPASGWRSWARSVAATRDAWPRSTHRITPEEPGSAAKARAAALRAVSPAQCECRSPHQRHRQRNELGRKVLGVLVAVLWNRSPSTHH